MKKYLILGFVIVLAVFVFYTANAQTTPTISLGTGSLNVGSTGPITITMANNSTATGANFDVVYDPAIVGSPTITKTSLLINAGFSLTSSKPTSSSLRVVVINIESPTVIPNGVIANITFSGVAAGTSALTFSNVSMTDAGANTITGATTAGSITVNSASHATYTIDNFIQLATNWLQSVTPNTNGDVNNDGKVNTQDLGIMMSYWAG